MNHKLTAAESTAFQGNLQRLRDLLLALPVFHPARGVEAAGWMNMDPEGLAAMKAPIAGTG